MDNSLILQLDSMYKEISDEINNELNGIDYIDYLNRLYIKRKKELEKDINLLEFRIEDLKKNGKNSKSGINQDNIISLENEIERQNKLIENFKLELQNIVKDEDNLKKQLSYMEDDLQWAPIISGFSINKNKNEQKHLLEKNLANCQKRRKDYNREIKTAENNIKINMENIDLYKKAISEYEDVNDLASLERNLASKKSELIELDYNLTMISHTPSYYYEKIKDIINSDASLKDKENELNEFRKYISFVKEKIQEIKVDNVFISEDTNAINDYKKLIDYNKKLIDYNKKEIANNQKNIVFYDQHYNETLENIERSEKEIEKFRNRLKEINEKINNKTDRNEIKKLSSEKIKYERYVNLVQAKLFDFHHQSSLIIKYKDKLLSDTEFLNNKIDEYETKINNIKSKSPSLDVINNKFLDDDLSDLKLINEEKPIDVNSIDVIPEKKEKPRTSDRAIDLKHEEIKAKDNNSNYELSDNINTKKKGKGKKIKAIYNAPKHLLEIIKNKASDLKNYFSQFKKETEPKKSKLEIEAILEQNKINLPTIDFWEMYYVGLKESKIDPKMESFNIFEVSKPGETEDEAFKRFKNKLMKNYDSAIFVKLITKDIVPGSIIAQKLNIDITSGDLYAVIPKSYYTQIMNNRNKKYEKAMQGRKK